MVTKSNTVYVGIVDTGIDVTHPDLSNIVDISKSRAYTGANTSAVEDRAGHGTGVASVVGMTTGTVMHIWGVDLDGTQICRVCGYYRVGQVESITDSETE